MQTTVAVSPHFADGNNLLILTRSHSIACRPSSLEIRKNDYTRTFKEVSHCLYRSDGDYGGLHQQLCTGTVKPQQSVGAHGTRAAAAYRAPFRRCLAKR